MLARKLTKKLEGSIVDRVRQRMMKSASLRRRQWRSNRRWNVERSLRPLRHCLKDLMTLSLISTRCDGLPDRRSYSIRARSVSWQSDPRRCVRLEAGKLSQSQLQKPTCPRSRGFAQCASCRRPAQQGWHHDIGDSHRPNGPTSPPSKALVEKCNSWPNSMSVTYGTRDAFIEK